jgi:hypothetical protein
MYDPPGIVHDGPWGKRNGGNVVGSNVGMKASQIVLAPPQHHQHPMQPPIAHQPSAYSSLTYNGSNGRQNMGNSIPAHTKLHHDPNGSQYLPYFDGYRKMNENVPQLSPVKKRVKESSPQGQSNGKDLYFNSHLVCGLHSVWTLQDGSIQFITSLN